MIPGNPQANMYFTLYGYNTLDQARGLIRDLKMVSPLFPFILAASRNKMNRANTPSCLLASRSLFNLWGPSS